jgi:hypothetical protein
MVKQSQSRAQQQQRRRRRLFLLQRRHNGGTKDQWAPVMTVMMMMMTRLSLSLSRNIRKTVPEPFVFVFLFGILPTRNKSTARIFSFESRDVCSSFFCRWTDKFEEWPRRVGMCGFTLTFLAHGQVIWKKGRNKRGPFYNLLRLLLPTTPNNSESHNWKGKKRTSLLLSYAVSQ